MSNDKILFMLLVAILSYRAIDFGANRFRIEQALMKASSVLKDSAEWEVLRVRKLYRHCRPHLSNAEIRRFVLDRFALSLLSAEFLFLSMGLVLIVLVGLGLTQFGVEASVLNTATLALATFLVSIVISAFSGLVESFRWKLELIQLELIKV